MYGIVKSGDTFLTKTAWQNLMKACDDFHENYNALTHAALARKVVAYNIVFKHHALYHICEGARALNPRKVWAYRFEDFMNKVVVSARSCVHGTSPERLG
eukprot:1539461-Alexandrium_andersonii.AAC.1